MINETTIALGGLLHEIGRIILPSAQLEDLGHEEWGRIWLKDQGFNEPEILAMVGCHHVETLKQMRGQLSEDARLCAEICIIASNAAVHKKVEISEATNTSGFLGNLLSRKSRKTDKNTASVETSVAAGKDAPFHRSHAIYSIFDRLTVRKEKSEEKHCYAPKFLENGINLSSEETDRFFDDSAYEEIEKAFRLALRGPHDNNMVNRLLLVMEQYLTFFPADDTDPDLQDVSMYDYLKLTAGIALTLYAGIKEKRNKQIIVSEDNLCLMKIDIRGIQKFLSVVNIDKSILMMMRELRSGYLDILLEYCMDYFLEKTGLSRVSVLYSGGGHCYVMFPNTSEYLKTLGIYEKEIRDWFVSQFRTDIYPDVSFCTFSIDDFCRNDGEGCKDIFGRLAENSRKNNQYDMDNIIKMNQMPYFRKICDACGRGITTEDEIFCDGCRKMVNLQPGYFKAEYFAVFHDDEEKYPALPGRRCIRALTRDEMDELRDKAAYIYAVGRDSLMSDQSHLSLALTARLWMNIYSPMTDDGTFAVNLLHKFSNGKKAIGIFRGDVDNLGECFISGLKDGDYSLLRIMDLSHMLTIFFKYYSRLLLEFPKYRVFNSKWRLRLVRVVYAGGDDLFYVGPWNDCVEAAVEVRNNFERFTGGRLSLSGGIDLCDDFNKIADVVKRSEIFEKSAKQQPDKNSVAIGYMNNPKTSNEYSSPICIYKWEEFSDEILKKHEELKNSYELIHKTCRKNGSKQNVKWKDRDLLKMAEMLYLLEGGK